MIRRWLLNIVKEAIISRPVLHVFSEYGPTDEDNYLGDGSVWKATASGKTYKCKCHVEWVEVEK